MIMQRLRALERKLARELAQIEAQELAEEYMIDYYTAKDKKQPLPDPFEFCMKVAKGSGYFRTTFPRTLNYLERCARNNEIPDGLRLIRHLLPFSKSLLPEPTFLM